MESGALLIVSLCDVLMKFSALFLVRPNALVLVSLDLVTRLTPLRFYVKYNIKNLFPFLNNIINLVVYDIFL